MDAERAGSGCEATLAAARAALDRGDIENASQLCEAVQQLAPDYPPAVFLSALVDARRGDSDKAIDKFRALLRATVDIPESFEWLSNLLRARGDLKEATYLASHLVHTWPSYEGGFLALGMCFLAHMDPLRASSHLEHALKLNPRNTFALLQLALACEQLRQGSRAEACYEDALLIEPENPQIYGEAAEYFLRNHQPNRAVSLLKAGIDRTTNVELALKLSTIYSQGDDPQGASEVLRQALSHEPDSAVAHYALALNEAVLGRFGEATEELGRAIEVAPNWVAPYFEMSKLKKLTHEDGVFVESLLRMLQSESLTDHEKRQIHYSLGKAYDDLREYEAAIGHYEAANELSLKLQLSDRPWIPAKYEAWVSEIISFYNKPRLSGSQEAQLQSSRPLLIVGMIRSGTTLLEQILSTHPEVDAGGEIPFWTQIEQVDLVKRAISERISSPVFDFAASEYLRIIDTVAKKGRYVTDKMPLNFYALGLVHMLLPNVKIIHCRRNPVDTALSIFLTPFDDGPGFGYDRENIVSAYRQYERLMNHWRQVLPTSTFLEVQYEDILLDKPAAAKKMFDFLNLEMAPTEIEHEANLRPVKTPSQWQVRQPIYHTSMGRWKNYERHLGAFRRLMPEARPEKSG